MRWWTLLLLLSPWVRAESVLVPAPTSSLREYQARLHASPEYLSPAEAYMRRHPAAAARERLLGAFTQAQKSFLENDTLQAREGFLRLVRLVEGEDWDKPAREIFLAGYLRLAQLESDPQKAEPWLMRALLLGPGLQADKALFPPPLLARLEQLRVQTPKERPRIAEPAEWNRVLINGVVCQPLACPEFPQSVLPVRVTFLSDKWLPQTVQAPLAEIARVRPERTAWMQGPCGQPEYHPRAQELGARVAFWSLSCEKPPSLDLRPAVAPAAASLTFPLAPPARRPRAFYESKWFWIGVGAVTAAVIVAQSRRSADSGGDGGEPSTTYGY